MKGLKGPVRILLRAACFCSLYKFSWPSFGEAHPRPSSRLDTSHCKPPWPPPAVLSSHP